MAYVQSFFQLINDGGLLSCATKKVTGKVHSTMSPESSSKIYSFILFFFVLWMNVFSKLLRVHHRSFFLNTLIFVSIDRIMKRVFTMTFLNDFKISKVIESGYSDQIHGFTISVPVHVLPVFRQLLLRNRNISSKSFFWNKWTQHADSR